MIFKQVFDTKTSTYTYLIASAKGREAVIIDPVIDNVNDYIQLLKDLDLQLVKVIDTHIHAPHTGPLKFIQGLRKCIAKDDLDQAVGTSVRHTRITRL